MLVNKLVNKLVIGSVVLTMSALTLCNEAYAQTAPFRITTGLFDLNNQNTAGLENPQGLQNVDVYIPTDNTDHYSNQVMMAAFKGVIHMMWQNSPTDEDTDDTVVTWIYSSDNGETWSKPAILAKGDDKTYCTSGGWLVTEDKLIAYINVWNYGKQPLRVDYMTTTDGINWSERQHVKMADGSDLGCEFGQDPHIFKNGRIICSGHFPTSAHPEGKHLWPLYTDDPLGVTGWKKGTFANTAKSTDVQTRELEPSFYQKDENTIVMTMRDQKSSYYVLASVSTDNGETWSNAVQTNMPDSRSKQCAGNLPDGTAYIVNNPYRINKPRCPLAITLSKDGETFTHSYLLRGLDELPAQAYSGWAKTLGYSYPKAMVYNGYLWVSYSIQKERVGYSRIPLSSISLRSGGTDEPTPAGQPVGVTFKLDQGTGGQRASFDSEATAQLFKLDYMEYGSHLNITGKTTTGGSTQTLFQPKAQDGGASELNAIDLMVAPKHGLTFTPTRISFQTTRYGTDGGLLNVEWRSSYTQSYELVTALQPARDNASPAYTDYSYDITGIKGSDGACGLRIYLYNLGETKQVGLGNIVIEGTISGEATEATQYKPLLNVQPEGAGTISISPEGTTFETGDRITLTQQRNFGYKFLNWTDGDGNILSKEDQYTYFITDKAASITANYVALKSHELQLTVEGGADESMIDLSPKPTVVDGKMLYEDGQRVTLTAQSNNLFAFTHWSNGESSKEMTLQMTQDVALTAYYASADFIAAWTFVNPGNKNRYADFANEQNQETMLVLQDAEGNSVEWTEAVIQDRYAAVNGRSDKPIGTYYFQTKCNTTGYQDITVSTGMSYNANAYKNQLLEYSLDGNSWTKLASFTYSSRSRWRTGTYSLPAEANNQPAVWLRWKSDTTSDLFGSPSGDSDGAALGETTITGNRITTGDGKAPQLTGSLPEEGAKDVPVNGNIVLYFDRTIIPASNAKATLGNQQLTANVKGSTAVFEYKNLDYATAYTFTLPAAMLSGKDGQALQSDITISFTTQGQPKVMKQGYDFIVPDDGSIAEALTAAMKREDTSLRYRIFVKNGTHVLPRGVNKTYRHTNGKSGDEEVVKFEGSYPDPITYVTGGNISLIGESREGTIITNDIPADAVFENAPYGYTSIYDGIGQGDVLQISGSGYYFQDITIKSGIPDALGRNLAVHDKASKTIYKNTCLWGYQDTWTSNGSGPYYFEGGQVRGRTDYMCGKGDAFFNGVELLQLKGGYAAVPSQPTKWGWVYKDCIINGGEDGVDGNYTLGRPWGSGTPIALFIDTKMNVKPSAIGWSEMSGGWPKQFAEYNSTDGNGAAISLAERKTTFGDGHSNNPVLTADEAATYGDMKTMFGTWDPTTMTALPAAPTNVRQRTLDTEDGQPQQYELTWDTNDYVLGWAIVKDGEVVAFTTSPSYVTTDGKASYAVRAANEMGGLGEAAPVSDDTAVRELKVEAANGSTTIYSLQGIRLSKPVKGICIINGRKVVVK